METGSTSEGWEKGSVWPGKMKDRTEVGRGAQEVQGGMNGTDRLLPLLES